jgi:hypothetical protein
MARLNGYPSPVREDPGPESHSLLHEPHAFDGQEAVPDDGAARFANGSRVNHPISMSAATKVPGGGRRKARRSHRIHSNSIRKPQSLLTYSVSILFLTFSSHSSPTTQSSGYS